MDSYRMDVEKNRALWERKPVLRLTYRKLYAEIASRLAGGEGDMTLELGSGIGHSRDVMPRCITSDNFSAPWLDRVENAYHINYPDGALTNLVLFDVWHHLEYPMGALAEFARVLRRGGRVIVLDPAVGALGWLVYGVFHREPLAYWRPIRMERAVPDSGADMAPYAAVANCWRLFRRPGFLKDSPDWTVREVRYLSALAYLGSGGYSGPSLLPAALVPAAWRLEKLADRLPALFAIRMLVVLERA